MGVKNCETNGENDKKKRCNQAANEVTRLNEGKENGETNERKL